MTTVLAIMYLLIALIEMIIVIYTCVRIIGYINMKTEEKYQKDVYEKARRDLQEIDDQLSRK